MEFRRSVARVLLILTPLASSVPASRAWAAWSSSPYEHVALTAQTANAEINPCAASDGNGGAIAAWWSTDLSGENGFVWIQRVSADGSPLWGANGIPATTTPAGSQRHPQLVADQDGGVIVVWTEGPSPGSDCLLRAQRFDAVGNALWDTAGVQVAPTRQDDAYFFTMATDGSGGAIVVWGHHGGSDHRLRAQRLGSNGEVLWGASGKIVGDTDATQDAPAVATSAEGIYGIVWNELRADGSRRIRAQSLSATGDTLWDGVQLLNAQGPPALEPPLVLPDGGGGWMVLWNETGFTARAQRLSGSGELQWGDSGVAPFVGERRIVVGAIADGTGGTILLARHARFLPEPTTAEAQRLLASGARAWGDGGVPLSPESYLKLPETLVSDGAGGAICFWGDFPGSTHSEPLVYAQRLAPSGVPLWSRSGAAVDLTMNGTLEFDAVAAGDGVIAIWGSKLTGKTVAHRVAPSGALGDDPMAASHALTIDRVRPNPVNGDAALIRFQLPAASHVRVAIMDIRGASVRSLSDADLDPGLHSLYWDGLDEAGRRAPAGVYFVQVASSSETRAQKVVRLE